MVINRICQLSFLVILFVACPAVGQPRDTREPATFTLLYSSNVAGEYAPCG